MTTVATTAASSSRGWRQMIARHPVTAMLVLMFGVGWVILIPAALAGVPLIPLPLLATIFLAQLLPAVVVTAATGGRPAVRELFGRVFRWRVNPVWYALALLVIPVAALLGTSLVFGTGALQALFTDRNVILDYLSSLTILPLVNLWEETAWMGVVQAGLARYRGPLLAAVATGPLFGLLHMPLELGKPVGDFMLTMAALMVFGILIRIVIGWLYNVTGGSILLVAILHVTFNATNNTQLLAAAAPGQILLTPGGGAVQLVVAIWALALVIITRGRLGRRDEKSPGNDGEVVHNIDKVTAFRL